MAPTHRTSRRAGAVLAAGLALATLAPTAASAQAAAPAPVIGRWDLKVTGPDGEYPSWLEVSLSGNTTLVGRFVGGVGSARPIARVDFADGTLRFAIPPQWERDTADLRVEGTLAGDRMTGTLTTPGGQRHTWTAVRAPALRHPTPAWGTPVALFNGKDLAGWTPKGGQNKWTVVDGVLTNTGGGANLVTTARYGDFKLHAEFRYPKGSNSGLYLRGRYEVQIEDSPEKIEPGPLHVGGVYGFLPPNENAARAPGEWQTYDVTLVGRRVTVVLNGRTIIAEQIIPGITGGALDSDEGAPGPVYIQGDHGAIEFRRLTLTPAR
jgi:hypothetical protein